MTKELKMEKRNNRMQRLAEMLNASYWGVGTGLYLEFLQENDYNNALAGSLGLSINQSGYDDEMKIYYISYYL